MAHRRFGVRYHHRHISRPRCSVRSIPLSRDSKDVIPVVLGASAETLLCHEGRPVWPAPTAPDLAAIEQTAALIGARVCQVEATQADEPHGVDLVVGVGPLARGVARLYAHLTGRCVAHAVDVDSAIQAQPAVIVILDGDLTVAALDRICDLRCDGNAIGLIVGHDQHSLFLQALICSIAAWPGKTASTGRVTLLPTLKGESRCDGDDVVLDETANEVEIREALGRGAGVATIVAHSDGVDTNLGQLVLCPMDQTPVAFDRSRLPHCRQTGLCHRRGGIPIADWLADSRRLPPEAIAARVLVYAACWGVLPPLAFEDAAWGLGRRLLGNPRIGAMVTSWEVQSYDPVDLDELGVEVSAGAALGAALARLLDSATSKQTRLRLCLFGEPRLRLRPDAPGSSHAHATASHAPVVAAVATGSSFDARTSAELAFLRMYTHLIAPAVTEPSLVQQAISSISSYELAGARGLLEHDEGIFGRRMRESLLELLAWRGPVAIHNWKPLVRDVCVLPVATTCAHCGQRITTHKYVLGLPNSAERSVASCVRCGIVSDCASPHMAAIAIHDGMVHLEAEIAGDSWSARLAVYAKGERGPKAWRQWPAEQDGCPRRSMPVPAGSPAGSVDVALFMLQRTSLSTARVMARL